MFSCRLQGLGNLSVLLSFYNLPFFTFVGSKVGVAVEALASHLCDPGSVPVVGTWVEFVVGSVLAPRGFFRVLQIFSLHKNQHFQIPIQPGRQVFTHDVWSSHYDAKFDLPFFFTSNVRYIFLNVSLFQFTRYLHCLVSLPFSIYMILTGFGPPNLHVIYRV